MDNWELIETRKGWNKQVTLKRLSVPGGWLYERRIRDFSGGDFGISIAFVPRPLTFWGWIKRGFMRGGVSEGH